MNDAVKTFSQNLALVEDILNQLELNDEPSLSLQLTTLKIELDGVRVNHDAVDDQVAGYLEQLHLENLSTSLQTLVQAALGYYALAEQPIGSNEPPIGPVYAQQLLSDVQGETINLAQVKDALHLHLNNPAG